MVLLCSFNCNGLKNVDNFQNFVSALYEKNINFTMLQETFWDNDYVEGIEDMYEGKIYTSNGINSRQGVAIMVNNLYKDKTKLVYSDNNGRFIHISYEELQLNEHNRTILTTRRQKYINISILFFI
jgi:hypothetical protein